MPTDESKPTPVTLLDLAYTSRTNVLLPSNLHPPAANSLRCGKRRRHWSELPEDENPRPHMQFSEDSVRHLEVFAEMSLGVDQYSGTIADAILQDRVSLRRFSPAPADFSRDVGSALVAFSRVPMLAATQS